METATSILTSDSLSVTSPFMSTGSSAMTSEQISISVNLTYKYDVESTSLLKLGYTTDPTVLASVQMIVRSSFNLPDFTITVIRVEIRSQAKTYTNQMFTDNLFTSSRSDCDETCIKDSQLFSTPTEEFTLEADDGSLVNASAKSAASLVNTDNTSTVTTAIVNYQKGESPPGLGGRLGMGLGITLIGIVLIILTVHLYRKYGFNNPRRQPHYELTPYPHRLSV